ISAARQHVKETGMQTVPMRLRNAATGMMKSMGYGRDYAYPHDQPDSFIAENYFPDGMKNAGFYRPIAQGHEKFIRQRLSKLWPERY
ncbi:MAG: replication-associated recombination protein A, partial [Candidatus Marinimicrobia bacterium]|nr:replication-associated recombination protein A [Candidatus Neomarinimicrobiota bacterium]